VCLSASGAVGGAKVSALANEVRLLYPTSERRVEFLFSGEQEAVNEESLRVGRHLAEPRTFDSPGQIEEALKATCGEFRAGETASRSSEPDCGLGHRELERPRVLNQSYEAPKQTDDLAVLFKKVISDGPFATDMPLPRTAEMTATCGALPLVYRGLFQREATKPVS
jgi:hypothetical protein